MASVPFFTDELVFSKSAVYPFILVLIGLWFVGCLFFFPPQKDCEVSFFNLVSPSCVVGWLGMVMENCPPLPWSKVEDGTGSEEGTRRRRVKEVARGLCSFLPALLRLGNSTNDLMGPLAIFFG